ncbi:MAG TPA: hypothetical protein DCM51_00520 [Actinobacteria bacterium]|nr:hypothetical protein [Actinomycetota bacterium]
MTVSNADSINTLWRWIASDRDAAAFMQGKPDQWGTRINPNYRGMDLDIDRFPRNDLYCADISPDQPKLCEFDAHPYAADDHDAARSASRGDTLGRLYDPAANPPSFKKVPPQPVGQQGILAITDAATAARYGLPTAQLKNAAGQFVAADPASMRAAVGQMKRATGSTVLRPNPAGTAATAYPLTTVSYAATVPTKITKAEAAAYEKFIEYAVGAGQTLGTQEGDLPPGYAPLPQALRSEALSVAADIVKRQAAGPVVEPASITESAPPNSQVLSGAPVSVPIAPVQIGAVSPAGGGLPQGTPIGAVISAAQALLASVGTSRFGPAGALALGLAALISGPVLLRIGAGHA